jgi:hypothetical protein
MFAAWPVSVCAQASSEARAEPAHPRAIDAATRAAVRKLGGAGVEAYAAKDYETASEKLERAYQLMPVPSLALWSARALVGRGLWMQAAERYLEARRLDLGPGDPRIQLEARRMAEAERAALMPRIPSLRVQLEGAAPGHVSISIDGTAMPALLLGEDWPVNPGFHTVTGVRGSERVEATADVAEGVHAELVLRFRPPAEAAERAPSAPSAAPAPGPHPAPATLDDPPANREAAGTVWRTAGWLGVGVGGAALVTSAVLGLTAKSRGDELRDSDDCDGSACLSVRSEDVKSHNRLVDLATAGWISGAALVGAGALLVIGAPSSDSSPRVVVGPVRVSVAGRF